MVSILVLCLLSYFVFVSSETQQVFEKRIVGGKPTKQSTWPMIVSIRQQGLEETLKSMNIPYISKSGHFCSGTLITPDWVVTAASCFPDKEVQKLLNEGQFTPRKARKLRWLIRTLVQRMNLYDYFLCFSEDCSIWRSVDKIVLHPKYMISIGINQPGYDVALIKLGKPVEEYIPDLIPSSNVTNLSLNCKTAGWGVSDIENYESSGDFREFNVRLVPQAFCHPIIKRLEFCGVGDIEGNRRSSFCFFDTGGPLMCADNSDENNWRLFGIISRDLKNDCDDPNQRGIYTNLIGYHKWINSVTGGI